MAFCGCESTTKVSGRVEPELELELIADNNASRLCWETDESRSGSSSSSRIDGGGAAEGPEMLSGIEDSWGVSMM
jgi:hypothetical protein